jgi:hypothetical protein
MLKVTSHGVSRMLTSNQKKLFKNALKIWSFSNRLCNVPSFKSTDR